MPYTPDTFNDGKLVILTSDNGKYLDLILIVENYDDRFLGVVDDANYRWHTANNLEYRDVVFDALHEAGYMFKEVTDYTRYDDPAG